MPIESKRTIPYPNLLSLTQQMEEPLIADVLRDAFTNPGKEIPIRDLSVAYDLDNSAFIVRGASSTHTYHIPENYAGAALERAIAFTAADIEDFLSQK